MIMSRRECSRLSTAVHLYMYSVEPAIMYLILEKIAIMTAHARSDPYGLVNLRDSELQAAVSTL